MKVGEKIHYSGDVCNPRGWFEVTAIEATGRGELLTLREIPGRYSTYPGGGGGRHGWTVSALHVGHVYHGHCDPRFVTEAAFEAWLKSRAAACN